MNRRDFIVGGAAVVGVAFAQESVGQGRVYNQATCRTLNGLKDYRSGKDFTQKGFVLAYFATPYKSYEGCVTDALNIMRLTQSQNESDLSGVLVFSPRGNTDPHPDFALAYTDPETSGGNALMGLTGEMRDVLAAARVYRCAFVVDRQSGRITDHNRSTVLIAPNGALLAKYGAAEMSQMADESMIPKKSTDIERRMMSYDSMRIRPASGCEVGI